MYGNSYKEIIDSETEADKRTNNKRNDFDFQSLKKSEFNEIGQDFELISENRFIKIAYPVDANLVNMFCPVCGKFVQNGNHLAIQSKNHRKSYLAHESCLTNQISLQMNGIYDEIEQAIIQSKGLNINEERILMIPLGTREFYIQIVISHPLSDYKFLKLGTKRPLVGSKVYWEISRQDLNIYDYQANIICIPFSDFKFSVFLSEIGVGDNKTKIQTYINLSRSRNCKSKILTATSQSISLEFLRIEDVNQKKNIVNQMNFKYAYQNLPLWMIQIKKLEVKMPDQFQESDQFQQNSNIAELLDQNNSIQSITSQSKSGTQRLSNHENSLSINYANQVKSQRSYQSPSKANFEVLISSNQLKSYVCNSVGSRNFQTYLKGASPQQIDVIINNLYPDLPQLTTHDYANYMIQKVFTACNLKQRIRIMKRLETDISSIVKNKQGTHTIQSFISLFISAQEYELMCLAIQPHFIDLCMNSNSTHFIQKIINVFPIEHTIKFFQLVNKSNKTFVLFATDKNAMCVLKHQMRKFKEINADNPSYGAVQQLKKQFIHSITFNTDVIIQDSYGNYIVQFCFEQFGQIRCEGIRQMIIARFFQFAIQKYSSSVVLKCISTYWKNSESFQKLKSILTSENIIEMYRNPDGNKILLQIMEKHQNTFLRTRIFNLLVAGEPTKFYHDRWGYALGCRSGTVGSQFTSFTEATQGSRGKKKYS